MKIRSARLFIIMLCIALAFCLAGCSSEASDDTQADNELQAHESSITAALSDSVPVLTAAVTQESDRFTLNVSVGTSGSVTSFGNYVLAVRDAFEAEFDTDARGSFSVSMAVKPNSLLRFSSNDYSEGVETLSGTLSDTRSGTAELTRISCLEDLFEKFPAAQLYAEDNGIE